jgi:tRNA-splicing ligase RtcB
MKIFWICGDLVIKSWCENPEDGAIKQAMNLAKLPFAFKQICLMPDTHQGYGMPIGGVMATIGAIVPNAVGVDIGCGMCAIKTSLTDIDKDTLKLILGKIRQVIPVGFNKHKEVQDVSLMPNLDKYSIGPVVEREFTNACLSLGTLGGGNHFIEIQKGDDGNIWIMIHSGSRNLGKQVADYYNKKAVELNEKYFSKVEKEWQLAFLPLDTDEAKMYLNEMNYCVAFALANRSLMMSRIIDCFADVLNVDTIFDTKKIVHDFNVSGIFEIEPMINIAHNYVAIENHFGKNVWVHRKGATSARLNEIGIIPGSQGTSSYIVRGKGNYESFMSCSHGAGRSMGRKEASRSLDLAKEIEKLDSQGIIHGIRNVKDLDEAAGAYKDIDVVMKEQEDLVDIVVKLRPLAVIKG